MSSRLDPYFSLLFAQLNDQGLSYRTVARQLLQSSGIVVSPQALRSWHLRRINKIANRAKGLVAAGAIRSDLASGASVVVPMQPSTVLHAERTKSVVKQSVGSEQVIAQRRQLQVQIEEEEHRLATFPSGGQTHYPARRRTALGPSTNQVFQTIATWQTRKDRE